MLNVASLQNNDDDIHIVKNDNGEDVYVFDPHNPLNVEITQKEVEVILSSYGIDVPIHNFQLYRRAFVHRSYTRRPDIENTENNIKIVPKPDYCVPLYSKSNERLEFIGDGILECITKYYLYRRFPKENEGFMTEKKIALVKNESIGRMTYEMGINKWFILSKNAESKQTRNNLKKLGCLFEAFIGAMFLDFNKMSVKDEDKWFEDVFVTGPGFQMTQIFIERIFEKHVDWIKLIQDDDNYKNILQVKIQKEFKVTPYYVEINQHEPDVGYHMGVYLCLGQQIHNTITTSAVDIHSFRTFKDIHQQMSVRGKIFIFLGDGVHKIKKKAEQTACEMAISNLDGF
jgi:dsRNA-specific ribonuclease